MTQRYLITGAAGFVGSHLVRHLLTNTEAKLILPVTFKNRGNMSRLRVAMQDHPEWDERVQIIYHDLRGPFSVTQVHEIGRCDVIFNLASNSHVDRSITSPVPFVQDNVGIVLNVLELALAVHPDKVIQVSTDEVYGPAGAGELHPEWAPIIPSNPYSASKAAQEAIAISYWRTYGVPLILTNTMNIIGETQDREKFVPLVMHKVLRDETVPVHVDTDGTPGSRFYLHARNQADALLFIAREVAPKMYPQHDRPERIHVVGEREVNNIEMVHLINSLVQREVAGVAKVPIQALSFHSSRPGHDLRYALDGAKLAGLGWKAPLDFETSLARTVQWTLAHREWLI